MSTYDGFSTDDWIDDDGHQWQIQVQWGIVDGHAEVVAFTIASAIVPGVYDTGRLVRSMLTGAPLDPLAGDRVHRVSSELLRKVPFGSLTKSMAADYTFPVSRC